MYSTPEPNMHLSITHTLLSPHTPAKNPALPLMDHDTIRWLFNDPTQSEQTQTSNSAPHGQQQQRPSQMVSESLPVKTPNGKHAVIFMERVSTGGTKYQAHFKRAGCRCWSDEWR